MVGEDAEVQAVHLVLPWDTESSPALHLSTEITRGIDVYSPLSVKKKKKKRTYIAFVSIHPFLLLNKTAKSQDVCYLNLILHNRLDDYLIVCTCYLRFPVSFG